jgi:TolB-like protein/DNA-binding winged helix-turn-helix (wHTH) protein/Flp pilus assembly protein TadD
LGARTAACYKIVFGFMALLRFGAFELDPSSGELRRSGALVKLQPQPFKVLAYLAANGGRIVPREELAAHVWGAETHVDFERGLNYCILQVRTVLGDDAESPRFVQTLPRRGYRFLASVEAAGASASAPPPVAPVASATPRAQGAVASTAARPRPRPSPVVFALVLLLAAGILSAFAFLARPRPAAPFVRTRLAVLPFEALSPEPDQQVFGDGMTEELITRLGRLDPDALGVIARTSVMRFKGTRDDVGAIGRTLGVDYVLEGSVRREASRVRVTAQLIRVSDQTHLWAETYDRTLPGSLTVQEEIASRVAAALALRLLTAGAGEASRPRVPEAYDAYLQARSLAAKGGVAELRSAVSGFEEAIRLDPRYAPAHASLASTLHLLRMRGALQTNDAYPRAAAAARRAIELDDGLAEGHTALAAVRLWAAWDVDGADEELVRALARNASDAAAHHDRAWVLVVRGQPDEAAREIERAQQLDPLSPRANVDVGWVYLRLRRYDEAAAQCRRTLALEPDFTPAEACLAEALGRQGKLAEAAALLDKLVRTGGERPAALPAADPSDPAATLRRFGEWRLERLRTAGDDADAYAAAAEEARLGRADEALRSLESALRARAPMMVLIESDPSFDDLRKDPRFEDVVQRVRAARRS